MIGKISGILELRGPDHVMIDTGGVGYVVYCSDRTLAAMPAQGAPVAVFTDMVVREDLLQLYGFLTVAEREWHRLLTSVQGVGAKAALAIQGTLGTDGVGRAIALADVPAIKSAPGVGPKIAQRVVLELKDKAPAIMALGRDGAQAAFTPDTSGVPLEQAPKVARSNAPKAALAQPSTAAIQADALSALANLGYSPADAASAVAEVMAQGDSGAATDTAPDTASVIRLALRRLAPQG